MRPLLYPLLLTSSLCLSGLAQAGLYEDAQQKIAAGEERAAIIYLKNLLQKQPDHQDGRGLLGQLLADAQQWGAAEKELLRALKLGAAETPLLEPLIRSQIQQRKWQAALTTLDERWPDDHRSAERMLYRGDIHLGLGQLTEAESAYYQALQLAADNRATLGLALIAKAKGTLPEALSTLEPIVDDPELGQRAKLLKAEILLDMNQAEPAMAVIIPMIAAQPDAPQLKLLRAQAYAIQQQFDKVEADLASLPDSYQQSSKYLMLSAFAALGQKDYDAAYQHSNNLLQQQPNNPQALLLTGTALHLSGDNDQAIKHLSRFVELIPHHLNGRLMLASTQQALRKPTESLQTLQPVLDLAEPPAKATALAGYAYIALGDWEKGEQLLSEAMAEDPQLENLRSPLAMSQIMSGKADRALALLADDDEPALQQDALRVTAYLRQQQFAEALDFIEQRRQSQPDNATYPLLAGMVYLNQQDFDKARQSYETALDIAPDNLPARFALIRLNLQQKNFDIARRYAEEVLEREPDNLNALMSMAVIAEKTDHEAAMLSWLEQASQRNDQALQPVTAIVRYYLTQQQNDKARTEAHGFYLSNPEMPGAIALYTHTLRSLGDSREAVKHASRLVQRYPNNTGYLRLLAETHLDLGEKAEALKHSQKAMSLNPELSANLLLHTRLLLANGETEQAEQHARQLLKQQSNPLNERLLGMVLMAQGKEVEALPHLEAAAKAHSDGALTIALADAYLADRQPQEAIRTLTEFLKDNADAPTVQLHLANILYASGEVDKAMVQYQALTDNHPDHPVAWNNLAWILMERDDPRSLEYARTALELAPEDANVLDTAGWVLLQSGEYEEALKLLKKAAELEPENPEVQFHYAKALLANQQPDAARKILDPLSKANHRFSPDASELLRQLR